jgi:hypothetical protein
MPADRYTAFSLTYKKICYKGKHRDKGSKLGKRPLAPFFKYHDNGGNQSAGDKINNEVRNIHNDLTPLSGPLLNEIN